MYTVVSHTHACHNILFNDQLMAMESFMLVGTRSTADHVCAVLNTSLKEDSERLQQCHAYAEYNCNHNCAKCEHWF